MSAPLLEASKVSVRRNGRAILHAASCAVHPGTHTVIIGPNGAGKSTLLKCLAGVLRPDEGSVLLDGKPLSTLARRAAAQRISYVPQQPEPDLPYTVGEFVLLARYARQARWSGPTAADERAATEAMQAAGVNEFRDRILATLSGGESRRVHIAAALAQGGDVMLLDEPAAHLDYRHQAELHGLLRKLRDERGLAVITVSHDLHLGLGAADRLIVLDEGSIIHDGPPRAWLNEDHLQALYGVAFAEAGAPGSGQWVPLDA
ncbi:MAG: ATP-binding cassette domain-containing protein [Candidatus Hydrogenedens sp.]|nr:ATP-binding cassette domain-containing protein [Candidatus Hydrogenedens sp.]